MHISYYETCIMAYMLAFYVRISLYFQCCLWKRCPSST